MDRPPRLRDSGSSRERSDASEIGGRRGEDPLTGQRTAEEAKGGSAQSWGRPISTLDEREVSAVGSVVGVVVGVVSVGLAHVWPSARSPGGR